MDWKPVFDRALGYDEFLDVHGSPIHRERWRSFHDSVSLSPIHKQVLAGFTREMNVLCLAGTWCGDCANQCPIFQRFAEATPRLKLRFLDRDADSAVRDELSVNGGQRVPVIVFLSEDFYECGRYGDRTLSKYRHMAGSQVGAACSTGIAGGSIVASVVQEWLDEFERIQLMLRLSARLREMHRD